MNNNVLVYTKELDIIKSRVEENGNDLINTLTRIIKETELTKDYYDSLTGDDFRTFLIEYLNDRITYIEDNYLVFVDRINDAKNIYNENINSVSKMVGDNE